MNPMIESRKAILARLADRKTFQERFAAAEVPRRPLPQAWESPAPAESGQDVLYYGIGMHLAGFARVFLDPALVTARFTSEGAETTSVVMEGQKLAVLLDPLGMPMGFSESIRDAQKVLYYDRAGELLGSATAIDTMFTEYRDAEGHKFASGIYGPRVVNLLDSNNRSLGKIVSNGPSGRWLSVEDAWTMFAPEESLIRR